MCDEDWMHNHQDEGTCEENLKISKRLPEEGRCSNPTDHIQMTSSMNSGNFAMLSQHEHLHIIKKGGEDISQKKTQNPHHANTDQPGEMEQSGSSQKQKQKKTKIQKANT